MNDNKRLISDFVLQIYKMKNPSVGVGNRIHKRRRMAIKQYFCFEFLLLQIETPEECTGFVLFEWVL